jgi:hypothetical protein
MFILVDVLLLVCLGFIIFASIKFGFTRNFIFGILRTIFGIAGGIGACVGVYLLLDAFGWLNYLGQGVAGFFGNPEFLNPVNAGNFAVLTKIVAYLPFGVLFIILGYILVHFLVNLLFKGIFAPIFFLKKKSKAFRTVDNVIGLVFNLGLFFAVVLAAFGFIHGVNTVKDGDDYVYDNMSSIMFTEDAKDNAIIGTVSHAIDDLTTPLFNALHEGLSASPIGSFLYEYNPLNGLFTGIVESMFNI